MKKVLFSSLIFIMFFIMNFNISFANSDICKISLDTKNIINRNETLEINLNVSDINREEGVSAINGIIEYDNDVFEEISYEKNDEWNNFYQLNNVIFVVATSMEEKYEEGNILKIKIKVKENAKLGETKVKFSKIDVLSSSNKINTIEDIEKTIKINNKIISDDEIKKDKKTDDNDNQNENNNNKNNENNDNQNVINNNKQNTNNNQITPNNTDNQIQENNNENNYREGVINNEEMVSEKENSNIPVKNIQKTGKTEQNTSLADKILSKTGLEITSIILAIIITSVGIYFYIKYKKLN